MCRYGSKQVSSLQASLLVDEFLPSLSVLPDAGASWGAAGKGAGQGRWDTPQPMISARLQISVTSKHVLDVVCTYPQDTVTTMEHPVSFPFKASDGDSHGSISSTAGTHF